MTMLSLPALHDFGVWSRQKVAMFLVFFLEKIVLEGLAGEKRFEAL